MSHQSNTDMILVMLMSNEYPDDQPAGQRRMESKTAHMAVPIRLAYEIQHINISLMVNEVATGADRKQQKLEDVVDYLCGQGGYLHRPPEQGPAFSVSSTLDSGTEIRREQFWVDGKQMPAPLTPRPRSTFKIGTRPAVDHDLDL